MAEERIMKVLANVSQGLSPTQKAQARSNIDAQASLTAGNNVSIDANNVISATDTTYTAGSGLSLNGTEFSNAAPNVNADWNATSGAAEILNKPTIPTVHDGTLTIQVNGTQLATFSANQSGNTTANITGVGSTDVVTRTNGQGGYVEHPVAKLTLDTDFQQILTDGNEVGVYAPTPVIAGVDKVLTVTAGSDAPVWTTQPKIVTNSAPYTTEVDITKMTIYNPGQTYGSVVQDQNGTSIGYFVPKYLAPADVGKVLTVVNDDGYKCEWATPQPGYPQIDYMGHASYYVDLQQPNYLYMEDGVCYDIMSNSGGSYTLHLMTNSTTTIHSKIYLWGEQSNCMSATIVYEDEAGEVSQLQYTYGDTSATTMYALDVYARKVHVSGSISFDAALCRVYDYPCANRDVYNYNKDLGLVVEYIEPL